MSYLFHPSGGLSYQFKAMAHRNSLWTPFHQGLAKWLHESLQVLPQDYFANLVLVGPNCLHSIPDLKVFKRFRQIWIVEPDPIARLVLRVRFNSARSSGIHRSKIQFLPADLFFTTRVETRKIQDWLDQHPKTTILFSNILGQLKSILGSSATDREADLATAYSDLNKAVLSHESRPKVMSYHDRYSLREAAVIPESFEPTRMNTPYSFELLAQNTTPNWWQIIQATRSKVPLEINDHETHLVLPEVNERTLLPWQIGFKSFHWIEAVRNF